MILKYKNFILYIITVALTVFGVTIVFASNLVFDLKVETTKLSNNIFLDDFKLRNNLIIFSSSSDLSKFKLSSSCDLNSNYLGHKDNNYYFSLIYNYDCIDPYLYLKSGEDIIDGSSIKLNIYSESQLFSLFSDLSDSDLLKLKEKLEIENKVISALEVTKDLSYLSSKRKLDESLYNLKIIDRILNLRKDKYIVPILNHELSTSISKVPNSPRPYRETYTDGIHHGWDIDADFGDEVVALADGVIVRIVDGFEFSDLSNINYTDSSYDTKIKNLDILRGNQVWLKTAAGDVIFYSHLDTVSKNIKNGMIVSAKQVLGTVGKTGVPDKNYTDYHLHFAIQKNPYNSRMAGKYSFDDYMKWDWYFKGESPYTVIENQYSVFAGPQLSYTKQ